MTSSRREILDALGQYDPVLDPKPNVCRVFVLSNSGNRFEGYLHPPFPTECVDGEALGVDTIVLSDAFCHGPEGRPCRFPATPGPVASSDLRMRTSTILIYFVDPPSIMPPDRSERTAPSHSNYDDAHNSATITEGSADGQRPGTSGHADSSASVPPTPSRTNADLYRDNQPQPAFDQLQAARGFHTAQLGRRSRGPGDPLHVRTGSTGGSGASAGDNAGDSNVTPHITGPLIPSPLEARAGSPWVRSPGAVSTAATASTTASKTGYELAYAAAAGGYTLSSEPGGRALREATLGRHGRLAGGLPPPIPMQSSATASLLTHADSSCTSASTGVLDSGVGSDLPDVAPAVELMPSTLPADVGVGVTDTRTADARAAARAARSAGTSPW